MNDGASCIDEKDIYIWKLYHKYMIDKDTFLNKISKNKDRDLQRIERAYEFGKVKHEGQIRKFSGKPYFIHPVRVALSLISEDDDILIAGLLHDVLEDTDTTKGDIETHFGSRVATLVDGMTKTGERDLFESLHSVKDEYPEVVKIKLADRFDNMMDNFDQISDHTKQRYRNENPKLIAMAQKMGITKFVDQIQDLTGKFL